jgi:hypothetical protein
MAVLEMVRLTALTAAICMAVALLCIDAQKLAQPVVPTPAVESPIAS